MAKKMPARSISADEAGQALAVIADRLRNASVVEPEGFAALNEAAKRMKRARAATSWKIDVDRGRPVKFVRATDKSGNPIIPNLICSIAVDQSVIEKPPFSSLVIALEIDDEDNNSVGRWHVDLANTPSGAVQEGPLTHLQYGGHSGGPRDGDHPLKVPRWCHPPMELGLMSELVVANFFPVEWQGFRDDAGWCEAICLYQHLCYTSYLEKLQSCLSVSRTTVLRSTWAANWN
jgi:hypothetical protein